VESLAAAPDASSFFDRRVEDAFFADCDLQNPLYASLSPLANHDAAVDEVFKPGSAEK